MKRTWSLVSSSSSSSDAATTTSSTSSNKKRSFSTPTSSHHRSGCSSIQSQDVVVPNNTTSTPATSTTTASMTPHHENVLVTYRSPSLVSLQSDVLTVASSNTSSSTSTCSASTSPAPSLPQYDDDDDKCKVIQSKFPSKSNNNNNNCSCILTACSCPDLVESHQKAQQQTLKKVTSNKETAEKPSPASSSSSTLLLTMLPNEVLELCLSFLVLSPVSSSNDSSSFFSSVRSDRRNIQLTCKQLKECSQSPFLLREMNLCGDLNTDGKHSFILDTDTRESALQRLYPFVMARNVHAFHMVGMIEAYCFDNVTAGLLFLSESARCGYNPSRYVLGIMLRESNKNESFRWLQDAARDGYIPALQEILPANEMKDRFGDLSADELKKYFLDHYGVMKLMRRNYCHPHHSHSHSHYCSSSRSRSRQYGMASSHCWNPLCGKWAYKGVGVAGPGGVNGVNININNEQERNFLTMYSDLVLRTQAAAAAGETNNGAMRSSSSSSSSGSMGSTTAAPVFSGHANTATQAAPSCTFISSNHHNNNNNNNNNVVIVGPTENHSATNNNAAPANDDDATTASSCTIPTSNTSTNNTNSSLFSLQELLFMRNQPPPMRVARMKMCSVCRRAKYCSKLCQVYDWRSGRHKQECRLL